MTEKMCVVSSEDYGRDEQSAMVSLLVREYSSDTNSSTTATLICKTNIHTLVDKPLEPSKKCLYYWMILLSTGNN